jgi:hypothetical protein
MTKGAIVNLAKIFYFDYLEANGGAANAGNWSPPHQQQQQPPPRMQQQQQNQQQTTRFTFPGAGAVNHRPVTQRTSSSLDPETQAAINATVGKMKEWMPPKVGATQQVGRGN